jgi:hypothetical protein
VENGALTPIVFKATVRAALAALAKNKLEAISKLWSRKLLACGLGRVPSEGASGPLARPSSKQVLK